MNDQISRAVAVFRNSPAKDGVELHSELVTAGIDRILSARLVEFLPIAYFRVMLANSGARFAETFQRRLPSGALSAERQLSSEPVWSVALEFARAEVARGVSKKDLLALAGRNAEFDAVNQLLNRGSKLENIRFTPVLFPWPESGPTGGLQS
jgi:hypothetical protein